MSDNTQVLASQATVTPRSEHNISRANISPNALKVLYRLRGAGYRACLVGGGVRDLLLGTTPKDFDVGTDAHPEEVYELFRNCRLIGRRFRLAHVHFGQEIIEVATFRAQHDAADAPGLLTDDLDDSVAAEDGFGSGEISLGGDGSGGEHDPDPGRGDGGMIVNDNVYGTIEEDALRRDFTINALYYDIEDFSVLDYVGGLQDLEDGLIRLIGDPQVRYREDPVRMLRAVRFAAKLGFRIHPDTEAPLHRLGDLLEDVPPARLFDEVLKLFLSGHAETTLELLRLCGLLGPLLPLTELSLNRHQSFRRLLKHACRNTDRRIAENKPVTPAFLFAALLWAPLQERREPLLARGYIPREAFDEAADQVIRIQLGHTALPRRFSGPMREIWLLQDRFEQRQNKRALRFLEHPRFRAAYDFLLLRAQADGDDGDDGDDGVRLAELAAWWTDFQQQHGQPAAASPPPRRQRRPRRRRSRAMAPAGD